MIKLAKCPFCGGRAGTKSLGGNWKAEYSTCYASVGLYATEGDAIALLARCKELEETLRGLLDELDGIDDIEGTVAKARAVLKEGK